MTHTPLKIYNGTPEGVPLEIQGQQLPINELNGTPLSGACPISNLHRCKSPELIESIRSYIFQKATVLFASLNIDNTNNNDIISHDSDIINKETWDPIFNVLKYEIRYYSDIVEQHNNNNNNNNESNLPLTYPSETLDDYIVRHGDLKKLGPYDYVEFYKKMKDPSFYKTVKISHKKQEQMKGIKHEIILYVLTHYLNNIQNGCSSGKWLIISQYIKNTKIIDPIEMINIVPLCEYIVENKIIADEEPIYKNFRNNKPEFYEKYTLWKILYNNI